MSSRKSRQTKKPRRLHADFTVTFSWLHRAPIRQITMQEALAIEGNLDDEPNIVIEFEEETTKLEDESAETENNDKSR